MVDQMGHYLLELVKQGGPLAFLFLSIRTVSKTILEAYKARKELSANHIHLLSQEVSQRLEQSLTHFSQESLTVVNKLQKQLEELKKLLEKK